MAGGSKGIYVLVIELSRSMETARWKMKPGTYLYVGRAMNGLNTRLQRYLRPITKPHWHVDYLLTAGRLKAIVTASTDDPSMEHKAACLLASRHEFIPGFGSSDDRSCPSHLFRGEISDAINAVTWLGLKPVIIQLP